jgi:excisionase family DNA binding protein
MNPDENGHLIAALVAQLTAAQVKEVFSSLGYELSAVSSQEPYLSVKEAARVLDCGTKRIYNLKNQGNLRFTKDGGRVLTTRRWIDEYLGVES